MLQQITWKDYWTFIAIATAIYWFFIISIFYRTELLSLTKRKKSVIDLPGEESLPESNNKRFFANNQPALFSENEIPDNVQFDSNEKYIDEDDLNEINLIQDAHAAVDEIKEQIENAAEKKLIKEELLFALQQILKTYSQIKGTSFQKDINNFIAVESETHCSIHLSAEELNTLWVR